MPKKSETQAKQILGWRSAQILLHRFAAWILIVPLIIFNLYAMRAWEHVAMGSNEENIGGQRMEEDTSGFELDVKQFVWFWIYF